MDDDVRGSGGDEMTTDDKLFETVRQLGASFLTKADLVEFEDRARVWVLTSFFVELVTLAFVLLLFWTKA